MVSTSESIKKRAFEFLEEHKIKYTKIEEATYVDFQDSSNELGLDYWVVPYEYTMFQDELAFIYIADDLTQRVLQVLTKHGVRHNTLNL